MWTNETKPEKSVVAAGNRRRRTSTFCALVLLVAGVAVTVAAAKSNAAPPKGDYHGKPEISAGNSRGIFIWKAQNEGWHVRWATMGHKHAFSGTITTDGAFEKFEAVSVEGKDYVHKMSANTIRFDAKAAGGMDGLDFRLGPKSRTVTFDLTYDGKPAPLDIVKLGRKKVEPPAIPFTLEDAPAEKHQ